MNTDQFEGEWHKIKGSVKAQWGKLTNDDIDRIEGDREKLIGEIQSRYGKNKEEAKREFDNFINKL